MAWSSSSRMTCWDLTIMIDVMYQAPSMGKKRYVLTREFAQQQLAKSNFELLSEMSS